MPDNCKHWQALLAEWALTDALQPDPELDSHLATCAECNETLDEFRATAKALSHSAGTSNSTSASSMSAPAGLDARILARVLHAHHVRRLRRAAITIVAASAAAILLVVTISTVGGSTPASPTEQVALVAGDVHADATLQTRAWGTQIQLIATGFTPGQHYNVWLEQADGTHIPAGTFTGVRNTKVTVVLASALPSAEAVALGISEPGGNLVVRAPLD